MRVSDIHGEHLRYYVHSETHGDETHVVDLTENQGNGQCSCRDFETRCGPAYHRNGKNMVHYNRDDKGKLNPDRTQCKHIHAVRDYLLDSILPGMVLEVEVKRPKPVTIKETPDQLPF